MTLHTSYTQARANLASLIDKVTQNREVVIITRRGKENVALVSADELESLVETVHLLRSPANAERLLQALERALDDDSLAISMDQLPREVGLEPDEN
jgi:antitoxin YefM